MKKIYYSVIFSLAFSLFSCSDFLDRESLSELSNGNFWNTEADATKALVGCYDALQSEGSFVMSIPLLRSFESFSSKSPAKTWLNTSVFCFGLTGTVETSVCSLLSISA